eukprot:TRINITY_DN31748_c0_g1_i1.p1 TRINITY_DN31748_c0_g1~~TRINITY_DN31748_c0_g1_i1.p1  ORF type:complete len:357 (-),score=77.05 TRINITY_DN31748_c0_g1_i1:155-1225(-)
MADTAVLPAAAAKKSACFTDLRDAGALAAVLACLAADGAFRISKLDRRCRAAAGTLWPDVAELQGFPRWWSMQRVHQVQVATFADPLHQAASSWQPGPNLKSESNMLRQGADGSWCWLSGGTDWTGFQGCYRRISGEGFRPEWLSFRVQIEQPEFSGAFLALAADTHTWGLEELTLMFSYRGDESAKDRRCFAVQTTVAQHGGKPSICRSEGSEEPVACNVPHDVAIRLDWSRGLLSVFIDGEQLVRDKEFNVTAPIRYAALYNWRSQACAAFADLVLGPGLPCLAQPTGPAARAPLAIAACCPSRSKRASSAERWAAACGMLCAALFLLLMAAVALVVARQTGGIANVRKLGKLR